MRQRIAVISNLKNTAEFFNKIIKSLLNKYVDIEDYNLEDGRINQGLNVDLILISSSTIFQEVKKYVKNNAEIIILNYTMTKEGFNKLKKLPAGTRAMLVNLNEKVCLETIALIFQLGFRNFNLVSVYPGLNDLPDIPVAITPGEKSLVPKNVKKIIDIGDRVPDIGTIIDIVTKLNLKEAHNDPVIKEYLSNIMPVNYGLEKMLVENKSLSSQQNILLEVMDEGIIIVNTLGIIFAYNKSAENILGITKNNALGHSYMEILPEINFEQVLNSMKPIKNKLISINDTEIDLSILPIMYSNAIYGCIAIINRFAETEKKQHKLRAQLFEKGHMTKYTLDDILGQSSAIKECKAIARRIASSDAAVLITGASGTGKELFAQGIHHISKRRNYKFVAINCAALPENLLESELFGYEGGAFTGAKKEGKPGLFELAHNGTMFLDEIGDMPLQLQVRLLRALQEKTIMHIGGDNVINVNVRIICATNKNLLELVEQNKFRIDLYYRISVLPLNIPPLRERDGDIDILIEAFKKKYNTDFKFTDNAKRKLIEYSWPGNVRELKNYIEYFSNLGKKYIDVNDLPFIERKYNMPVHDEQAEDNKIDHEFFKNTNNPDDYILILKLLDKSYKAHIRLGRRSLANMAMDKGIFLSEQEIRSMLLRMESYGLVEIKKGRAGTTITKEGQHILEQI
jgi:transcriptional regulator with PAS, ATPase and Fis domain